MTVPSVEVLEGYIPAYVHYSEWGFLRVVVGVCFESMGFLNTGTDPGSHDHA